MHSNKSIKKYRIILSKDNKVHPCLNNINYPIKKLTLILMHIHHLLSTCKIYSHLIYKHIDLISLILLVKNYKNNKILHKLSIRTLFIVAELKMD